VPDPISKIEPITKYEFYELRHLANCKDVDTNVFFPNGSEGIKEAINYCRTCPIINSCLSYAIYNNELDGIWGGQTERARASLKRKLKIHLLKR
jgi:WhiB family redox-sensing transcriptional regulator